jgi:hypothetical protein
MNTNTGQLYQTLEDARADLKPGESEKDIVEVIGAPEAVESLSRAVQQARAIEKRRAANKQARKSRQANR